MSYIRYKKIADKKKTSLHHFIIIILFMLKIRVLDSYDYL